MGWVGYLAKVPAAQACAWRHNPYELGGLFSQGARSRGICDKGRGITAQGRSTHPAPLHARRGIATAWRHNPCGLGGSF